MATKSEKLKASSKTDKNLTAKLEVSLRKKIKDFVISLGHDAGDIGNEIKKTSKVLEKRLNKKNKKAKKAIEKKVSQVKKQSKKEEKKAVKSVDEIVQKAKKETKQLTKKASSVKKVDVLPIIAEKAKKTISATKPTAKPVVAVKAGKLKQAPIPKEKKTTLQKTPPVTRRKTAALVAKTNTKPQNTDLPLETLKK